jgi:hypothetical protein
MQDLIDVATERLKIVCADAATGFRDVAADCSDVSFAAGDGLKPRSSGMRTRRSNEAYDLIALV